MTVKYVFRFVAEQIISDEISSFSGFHHWFLEECDFRVQYGLRYFMPNEKLRTIVQCNITWAQQINILHPRLGRNKNIFWQK